MARTFRRSRSSSVSRRSSWRPTLEALEDRLAPALLTVTSLADAVVNDGQVTLREAITAANTNTTVDGVTGSGDDIIQFAAGLTGTVNLTGLLADLSSNLEIQGPGANLLTVRRDTGGAYRIFNVGDGFVVTLAGLTIANGSSDAGAGILNRGVLTVENATLRNNSATGSGSGGAIGNLGTLLVKNSTLRDNSAGSTGAAIVNAAGDITLSNSTLSGNVAGGFGGGLHIAGGSATLTNVTVVNNRADALGSAEQGGGGLIRSGNSFVDLRNTIIAGNGKGVGMTPDDIAGTVDTANSFNNIIGPGGAGGLSDGNNDNQVGIIDPRLGPLQDNGGPTQTHALLSGSPALDRGSTVLASFTGLSTDQRGTSFVRAADAADPDNLRTADIGAFEAMPSLDDIADQTTHEDLALTVRFMVADAALGSLSLSAVSSNQALAPNAGLVLGGSGPSRTLTIQPAADQFGTTTITVTVSAGGQTMRDTFILTVIAVNDAPVAILPAPLKVKANKTLNFAGAARLAIADVDSATVRVTLTVTRGTLRLASTAGFASVVGNGKAKMVLTGSVANINAALQGLRFKPKPGLRGKAKLMILTEDLGSFGLGGPKSNLGSISITIA